MPHIIIKHINRNTSTIPVILIDTNNEVLEFEDFEEALTLAHLLQVNSDSGHRYEVKSFGLDNVI